jgi:hypothetical protein
LELDLIFFILDGQHFFLAGAGAEREKDGNGNNGLLHGTSEFLGVGLRFTEILDYGRGVR